MWGKTNPLIGHGMLLTERQSEVLTCFGRRKDEVFLQLKALLERFEIKRYCTEWIEHERHLPVELHEIEEAKPKVERRKHQVKNEN